LDIFHTMNILNYLIQWSNLFALMERKYGTEYSDILEQVQIQYCKNFFCK
jgi:hypothetical protein